ncbi:AAA family ATPase [Paraphaeosphaeria minitans]|uniref:AAA family ATPase n=1 Tax=Paraphaeosphaeria minitans TaxID=565426 RepID=A0A9P6KRX5_9PLEO|nr:AAA family ATPase [Paraphaeosphaeria minitans]
MERCTTADLLRNSWWRLLLRALEFYDRILFLTTNRIGSFNDAFVSRIQFQLGYPDLADESRHKLFLTNTDPAFLIAVALAKYDTTKDSEGKIVMTDTHLRPVVEMSRDFKEYLKFFSIAVTKESGQKGSTY